MDDKVIGIGNFRKQNIKLPEVINSKFEINHLGRKSNYNTNFKDPFARRSFSRGTKNDLNLVSKIGVK